MKEFSGQFNKLKDIKADTAWRDENRQVLLQQIYGGEAKESLNNNKKLFLYLQSFFYVFKALPQSAVVAFFIGIFIFVGSIAGLRAAKDTKPGDSLYIAKILNEKTHFVLTFDEREKARLGLEYAGNRVEELKRVLAEERDTVKTDHVEKLIDSFKKNISEAKTRIAKINNQSLDNKNVSAIELNNIKKDEIKKGVASTSAGERIDMTDDEQVFSANLGKDEKGIELSSPNDSKSTESDNNKENIVVKQNEAVIASTSDNKIASGSIDMVNDVEVLDAGDILQQAEDLLNNNDYDATIDKLNQADEVISQSVSDGQIKGESASSSDETIDNGEVKGAEEEVETASGTKELL